jgi:hypothetical protein
MVLQDVVAVAHDKVLSVIGAIGVAIRMTRDIADANKIQTSLLSQSF